MLIHPDQQCVEDNQMMKALQADAFVLSPRLYYYSEIKMSLAAVEATAVVTTVASQMIRTMLFSFY